MSVSGAVQVSTIQADDRKMIDKSKSGRRAARVVGGVFRTAGLMFGLALALVYAYSPVVGDAFISPVIAAVFIIIGTTAGGVAGVRIARLGWRLAAVAALLSGAGLIAFSGIQASPLFPGPWILGESGLALDLRSTAIYLVVGVAGVFLLPLFDLAVRRTSPAPALWQVALAAFSLALLATLADYLTANGSFFCLLTLVIGSVSAAVLVGIGLILALLNLVNAGAWLGGLGIALQVFVLAAWWLLGSPWFP